MHKSEAVKNQDKPERWRSHRPNDRYEIGFFRSLRIILENIVDSRTLIFQLFRRNFIASFKKTHLGLLWLVLSPVVAVISWVFLNYAGVLKPGQIEGDIPYPLFVLLGSVIWGLFQGSYVATAETFQRNRSFLLASGFHKEALLFAQLAEQLATFFIGFSLNIILLSVFGVWPHTMTLLFPVIALPLLFLASGLGLLISLVAIVAEDIKRFFGVLVGLMMWLSPIVYTPDNISLGWVKFIIDINPMTHLVCSARDIILYGELYSPLGYIYATLVSLGVFAFAWRIFFLSAHRLMERNL